jgi:hypothetical protein
MKEARRDLRAKGLITVTQEVFVEIMCKKFSEAPDDRTGHGTGMVPEEERPLIGPGNQKTLPENTGFVLGTIRSWY